MDTILLWEMAWPQVQEALAQGINTVVVTFGSTEQHGPHLPLATDFLWGEEIGRRLARKLGNALLAPALRIGMSEHHMAFPGTITLRKEVFIQVVSDYCTSLVRHGFKTIILVPTHGGNYAPLAEAVAQIKPQLEGVTLIAYTDMPGWLGQVYRLAAERDIAPQRAGAHAGEWETSMVLALRPDLVNMDQAEPGFIGDMEEVRHLFSQGTQAISPNGILGDPVEATPEMGEAYLEALTDLLVKHIRARLDAR